MLSAKLHCSACSSLNGSYPPVCQTIYKVTWEGSASRQVWLQPCLKCGSNVLQAERADVEAELLEVTAEAQKGMRSRESIADAANSRVELVQAAHAALEEEAQALRAQRSSLEASPLSAAS